MKLQDLKPKYWLKDRILKHLAFTNGKSVTVYRNYDNKTVLLDYYGGRSVCYTYDGVWLIG